MMRQCIAECLDLCATFPLDILTEKLIDYMKIQEEQLKIEKENEYSIKSKHKISDLPLQDTFWSLKEVTLKHKDLSHLRMLVLSDAGSTISLPSTIQFSLEPATHMSYQDQAIQLICHGCFYPIDRKRSRRPRFLHLNVSDSASAIQLETDKFGIQFCRLAPTQNELDTLKLNFQATHHFRQCSMCGMSGNPDLFHSCNQCDAILYCGERCQLEDWEESHQDSCLQFKEFMATETSLANLPFDFVAETTGRDFDEIKQRDFLQKCGIWGQGLWRLEYPLSCHRNLPDDGNKEGVEREFDWCSVYGLEPESSILQHPLRPPDKPLDGWSGYYSLRGFPSDSTIAILLHFPLTLYYIISQLLPNDFHEMFASVQQSKKICIHLIGAEKEVEMFYPFLECARLLAPLSLHIHLFGNNFDDAYQGQVTRRENLHFQIHRGLYHRANHEHIASPNLAVCFNGGIGAYTSYIKTLRHLTRRKTPLYYTDYGQACIAFSSNTVISKKAGRVSQPQINPFRSPLRMMASDQNLPRYSNAFITHITHL